MNEISYCLTNAGSENNISFSSQEILKDCVFGLDGLNRKIIIIKKSNGQYSTTVIDLSEVKTCSVKKIFGSINVGDLRHKKLEQYLKKIVLNFELQNSEQPVEVRFFDHTENSIYQLPEMDRKARHWQTILLKMIGNPARSIA